MPKKIASWTGTGSGWKAYHEELTTCTQDQQKAIFEDIQPEAEAMVQLACKDFAFKPLLPAHLAVPHYLRNKVTD